MTGYELLTEEQRREMDDLSERRAHSGTMVFTALDADHLAELEALSQRLEAEYRRELKEGAMETDRTEEGHPDADCLFDRYDLQPPELARICEKYEGFDGLDYQLCSAFLREVEALGYTFEYGLDGVPFNLRSIGEVKGQFRHAEICEKSHKFS